MGIPYLPTRIPKPKRRGHIEIGSVVLVKRRLPRTAPDDTLKLEQKQAKAIKTSNICRYSIDEGWKDFHLSI